MKWIVLCAALILAGCEQPGVTTPGPQQVVIAVGQSGSIARSTDGGETWTVANKVQQTDWSNINLKVSNLQVNGEINQGIIAQLQSVNASLNQLLNQGFIGDLYVKGTLYQKLGAQWAGPITNPFNPAVDNLTGVAFGNGVFVVSSTSGASIARSTDNGATWGALLANPFTGGIRTVAFGNGVFVAGGANGKIARSTDNGATWGALIANPFGGAVLIRSIAFGNGIFVAVGDSGQMARSTDNGQTWGALIANPFGASSIMTIAFGNSVFVIGGPAAGAVGMISRSLDLGITWSNLITNPINTGGVYEIAFGGGVFVATGSTGGTPQIARSVDFGNSWGNTITNPFSAGSGILAVSYYANVFIAGNNKGEIAKSYDNGNTWGNLIANPFGALLIYGVAASTSNFVMTGQAASIATAGWNAVPLGTGAFYAPMPQSAAGVGQFTIQNAQGFTLPAGGTWAYMAIQFLSATGAFSGGFWAGIAAGGTTITGGTAGYTIYGWVWRIA